MPTPQPQPFGYMPPQPNPAFAQAVEHQRRWGMPDATTQLGDIAAKTGQVAVSPISAVKGLYDKVEAADAATRNPSPSSDAYADPNAMAKDPNVAQVALSLLGSGVPFAQTGALGMAGGKLPKSISSLEFKEPSKVTLQNLGVKNDVNRLTPDISSVNFEPKIFPGRVISNDSHPAIKHSLDTIHAEYGADPKKTYRLPKGHDVDSIENSLRGLSKDQLEEFATHDQYEANSLLAKNPDLAPAHALHDYYFSKFLNEDY